MAEVLPLNEVPEHRRPSHHWIVLGLLVVAHAEFGLYFTPNGKAIDDGEVLSVLMLGFLGSQPILLAIWAASLPSVSTTASCGRSCFALWSRSLWTW